MENREETIEVVLPKLGESITTATIVKWLKKVGDPIALDEPLLEVSTDKVNSEIPSPIEGFLQEIHANVDQEKEVGQILCVIAKKMTEKSQAIKQALVAQEPIKTTMQEYLSPAVLRLMQEFKLTSHDIEKMDRSGENGRVTKQDVERYVNGEMRKQKNPSCPIQAQTEIASVEKMKMNPLRKAIAENMMKSFYTAPHATLVHELDVTGIMKLIKQEKEKVLKEHQVKLSITTFLSYAIAKAIENFPLINSTLQDDTIILKKHVNLGIAVSIDQAVVVPVVKNAHVLNLIDLAKNIQDLAFKAKTGNLEPKEVKEGSITLTNFGMSGTLLGVPIIRYPEVAIIGAGAVSKKVTVLENDAIAIREMVYLSLTFDHRVLDGMYGCGFLAEIKKIIETTDWKL